MKPRKVIVTLEILTTESLGTLRSAATWGMRLPSSCKVEQVQANVVRPAGEKVVSVAIEPREVES